MPSVYSWRAGLRACLLHFLLYIGGAGYTLGGGGIAGVVFSTMRCNSVCRHCISYDDTLDEFCGGGGIVLFYGLAVLWYVGTGGLVGRRQFPFGCALNAGPCCLLFFLNCCGLGCVYQWCCVVYWVG